MSTTVAVVRTLAGSIDALLAVYTLIRARSFAGSNKYMRWALCAFTTALTYGQFDLVVTRGPVTNKSFALWSASFIAFAFFVAAVRSDTRPQAKD